MSEVLVLNRNYYAINITTWRRAFELLYIEHAEVVDEEYRTYNFADWCEVSKYIEEHPAGYIRTPVLKIAVPDVIALKFYDKLPIAEIKFTRKNIYERYNYHCCYCGKKEQPSQLNLDHVVPKSRGGKTTWENIVTSCISCNIRKADHLPSEVNMKLRKPPSKPKWTSCHALVMKPQVKIRTAWQKFIDNAYWNVELEKDI